MPDEARERLAALIRDRREARHLSQRELAAAANTTDRLVSALERAERTTYKPATLRGLSRSLGWTPDSIEHVLDGGDPADAKDDSQQVTVDERLDRIEANLELLLAELRAQRRENSPTS